MPATAAKLENSGYYGSLDTQQQAALDSLKKMLVDKHGIDEEASPIDERFRKKDYADPELRYHIELLRYLRARHFDLAKSYDMYMASRNWRDDQEIDAVYTSFEYARARAAFRKFFPSYIHKFDRSGSPVHVHELSKCDLDGLFKLLTSEEAVQYLFLLSESNIRERFPACTLRLRETEPDSDLIVDTVTAIFDLKGIGLFGFWRVKDILYRLIQISDNHYPETANKLFVINAPSGFATIWSYVKGWLDARTASRVFVLGSDFQQTLLKHIEESDLPTHLGGSCDCSEHEGYCRSGDIGPWNES